MPWNVLVSNLYHSPYVTATFPAPGLNTCCVVSHIPQTKITEDRWDSCCSFTTVWTVGWIFNDIYHLRTTSHPFRESFLPVVTGKLSTGLFSRTGVSPPKRIWVCRLIVYLGSLLRLKPETKTLKTFSELLKGSSEVLITPLNPLQSFFYYDNF